MPEQLPKTNIDNSPLLGLLGGFVAELRAAGLPVSLTENLDAMEAVTHIPIDNRDDFKYALGATLVKNQAHWRAFETVFEIYFSLRGPEYAPDDGQWENLPSDTQNTLGAPAHLPADQSEQRQPNCGSCCMGRC